MKPKNALVIMGDHFRADAMGCLGNPLALTPNLDRLSARSVRFENCFTQSPVCSPARHTLATGRYVHAHGVANNRDKPLPGMRTLAHALQPLGYRRFQTGHMHWGDPLMDNGYEEWTKTHVWLESASSAARKYCEWEHQAMTRRRTAGPSPRNRQEYSGYTMARRAIEKMESAVGCGEPFLGWVAFSEPHPPFYPPREIYERIDQSRIALPGQAPEGAPPPHPDILKKRREWAHLTGVEIRQMIAGYYGMVALLDEYAGTVLGAIDRLGVRDDTIVIFTSDHGDQMWEHRLFLKFVMREGAVHVPLLIHVPGCEPGTRVELVEHVDVFPTICELLGTQVPSSVQGRSLVPLLRGDPAPGDWRDAVFSQIGDTRMIRTANWKLNLYGGEPGELFDLKNDPKEFHNRIGDPACAGTIRSLFDRLKVWEASTTPERTL